MNCEAQVVSICRAPCAHVLRMMQFGIGDYGALSTGLLMVLLSRVQSMPRIILMEAKYLGLKTPNP